METKEVCGTKSKVYFDLILKSVIIFSLISCSKERGNTPCDKWIDDRYGCKGYRNIELAKSITSKNQMINNSKEVDIMETFGKADVTEGNLLNKELFYLSQSNCEGNKVVPNSDKCYIVFSFEYGYLKSISEMCE